jgi:hypothetical protein
MVLTDEKREKLRETTLRTSRRHLARRKEKGLIRLCVWVPDTEQARTSIKIHAELIRKRAGIDDD